MRCKRLLALLVSATLVLSLLAGCGGSKSLSQVIVDLLDGLYANVAVDADSDLTAALKKAAADGGTEEEILARMIEILNLNNVSITFTRLGSGQQGDHAVTLYFQPGTDPDAAARNALSQWASTLGTLPDDGNFQGDVAMIETENGYYIALDVEVLKAGKPDKPDEPEKDDGLIHANGMTYDSTNNSAIIAGENGLTSLVNTLKNVAAQNGETLAATIGKTDITLESNVSFPSNWPTDIEYEAEFDGQGNTITGLSITNTADGTGMFSILKGVVKNVKFEDVTVSGSYQSSTIAGMNDGGTIENCHVLSGNISGTNATGGLVGTNKGTISNSSVACTVNGNGWTGGITGENLGTNTITGCTASGDVNAAAANAGGITGYNEGSISDCKSTGNVTGIQDFVGGVAGGNYGTVTYSSSSGNIEGSNNVGGVVGYNETNVTACYSTGAITGTSTNTTCQVGGVAGGNYGTVDSCYAQGSVTSRSSHGFVGGVVGINSSDTSSIKGCYSSCAVTGSIDVGGVAGASNGSILGCFATGTITSTDSATTGGLVGEVYKGMVQGCYWSNNIQNGAGADQYQVGGITKIGSQSTDGLVTWGNAVTSMNAASGASVKFVNNDTSVPTLPIS